MGERTALSRLAGIYFNQDWAFEYDNWQQAVEAFVHELPDQASALQADLATALAAHRSDEELHAFMRSQGAAYRPRPEDGTYREWLTRVAGYVAARVGSGS